MGKAACLEAIAIYVLEDPVSGASMYVGQSARPDLRLVQHLSNGASRAVKEWVTALNGSMPALRVVAMAKDADSAAAVEDAVLRQESRTHVLLNGARPIVSRVGTSSSKHRISALLHADDSPELNQQGRVELLRVLEDAGSVRSAARLLGTNERNVWRWLDKADCNAPKPRLATFSDAELRAAIRTGKSASGAAKVLGVSHTTVWRRAAAIGIELQDGRALRTVRSKQKPV
jgi:molybdenum-dependent DNA-binding transcriptional regulator ModE